jgi:hypothetical protein
MGLNKLIYFIQATSVTHLRVHYIIRLIAIKYDAEDACWITLKLILSLVNSLYDDSTGNFFQEGEFRGNVACILRISNFEIYK